MSATWEVKTLRSMGSRSRGRFKIVLEVEAGYLLERVMIGGRDGLELSLVGISWSTSKVA